MMEAWSAFGAFVLIIVGTIGGSFWLSNTIKRRRSKHKGKEFWCWHKADDCDYDADGDSD
jgi:hypothetical protein